MADISNRCFAGWWQEKRGRIRREGEDRRGLRAQTQMGGLSGTMFGVAWEAEPETEKTKKRGSRLPLSFSCMPPIQEACSG